MSEAETIVEALLDGGKLVDEGGFAIDPDHALRKLAHGLADPHAYVIAWARAALLRGATWIEIRPGWSRTVVTSDARALRDDELVELASFRALPSDQPGDAASRRALVQGVQAGLARQRDPSGREQPGPGLCARLLCARPGAWTGLAFAPDRAPEPITGRGPSGTWTTTVTLDHPRSLARARERLVLATPEHRWVRQTLGFAEPAVVTLMPERQRVSGPLALDRVADRYVDLAAVGLDGLTAARSRVRTRKLALVVGGVRVCVRPLPADLEHIDEAIVRDDGLQLDASGFGVVADARLHAIVTGLREADTRWAALPDTLAPPRDWRVWLLPLREGPTPSSVEAAPWPTLAAMVTALFIPPLALTSDFLRLGLVFAALFCVPLAWIVRKLVQQRRFAQSNLGAQLPSWPMLVAGLVHATGIVLALARLLMLG